MELVTILIAGYAAIVATVVAWWQIRSWSKERRPHATVTVLWALPMTDKTGEHGAFRLRGWYDTTTDVPFVAVRVTNQGTYPIHIAEAGLYAQNHHSPDARVILSHPPREHATMPGTVDRGATGLAFSERAALEEGGFNLRDAVIAYATLESGETFKSQPTTLIDHE